MSASRFARGSGVFKCAVCKRLTRSTGRGDNEKLDQCAECFQLGGERNALEDSGQLDSSHVTVLGLIGTIAAKGGDASVWDDLRAAAEGRLA